MEQLCGKSMVNVFFSVHVVSL